MSQPQPGRIVTFYSYKGGTGRSMALANIAWILASAGQRVLVIDWDLEAPGLHRYFYPFLADPDLVESDGLMDFFIKFAAAAVASDANADKTQEPSWFDPYSNLMYYAYSVDFAFPKPGCLDLVPAGRQDENYSTRVNGFNWDRFYTAFGGGVFLEAVKQKLRAEYEFILIYSRTGVSDTSGICTVQMPDDLIVCFTLNRQSVLGRSAVARSSAAQRRSPSSASGLRVWPVPMRIDDAEKQKRDRIQSLAMRVYDDLLAHVSDRERYWGSVGVRYQPFYAYEEVLAVFGDLPHLQGSMLSSMEAITSRLTGGQVTQLAAQSDTDRKIWLERYTGPVLIPPQTTLESQTSAAKDMHTPHRYLFNVSHAHVDAEGEHFGRFIIDLTNELRLLTGRAELLSWLDRSNLRGSQSYVEDLSRALDQSAMLLSIVTPSYMQSDVSQRELELFQAQMKPILPVVWIPVSQADAPAPLRGLQWFDTGMPESYRTQGLRQLSRLSRYRSDYLEMVSLLAQRIVELSVSRTTSAPGADDDPVFIRIQELANQYTEIRKRMLSGRVRTQHMERVAAEMRALAPDAYHLLNRCMASTSAGERLAAIAMLQIRPQPNYLEWLAKRVDPRTERPFVGYHAAVALRAAVRPLVTMHFGELQRCLESALVSVWDRPDPDRDRTLQLALSELQKQRKGAESG